MSVVNLGNRSHILQSFFFTLRNRQSSSLTLHVLIFVRCQNALQEPRNMFSGTAQIQIGTSSSFSLIGPLRCSRPGLAFQMAFSAPGQGGGGVPAGRESFCNCLFHSELSFSLESPSRVDLALSFLLCCFFVSLAQIDFALDFYHKLFKSLDWVGTVRASISN